MRTISLQAAVRIAMIGAVLGSALAVVAIVIAHHVLEGEHGRMEYAAQLNANVGKLNLLITELSIQRSARTQYQWNRELEVIYEQIQNAPRGDPPIRTLADEILRRLDTTRKLFDRYSRLPERDSERWHEARELYFSSMVANTGAMLSRTREFHQTMSDRLKTIGKHVFLGICASILVLFAGGGMLLLTLCNRMLARILQVRGAIQEFSRGNLEAVLPPTPRDEVGDVFRELDLMRHSLLDSMSETSRVNLELTAAKTHLEDRVSERTVQLETANRDLEAFTYAVSHDLRAPLRTISGFSSAVLEESGDRLDAEGKDMLTRVVRSTQNMNQLIDDLLRLSRITQKPPKLEMVNLSRLVSEIGQSLRERYQDRDVELTVAPGIEARCDGGLMAIALTNLIENAWKFTGGRPRAHIEFGLSSDMEPPVFFVRDDGAGFDMAFSEKLFQPFKRLHSAAEFAGTGIGLATVARVIRLHGGRIWAQSSPGEGATFFIQLGVVPGESGARDEAAGEQPDAGGKLPLRRAG